jgi:Mrp family chromosome partitioning ATPase
MSHAVIELKSLADVIIFDCPPIFLADTLVLSEKVEGVLVVICIGHSRKKSVVKMLDQVQKNGVNLIGIVLNRVSKNETYEAGYYRYYRIKETKNVPMKTGSNIKN